MFLNFCLFKKVDDTRLVDRVLKHNLLKKLRITILLDFLMI